MYELTIGNHATPEEGRCAMEWVAYLAGEKHNDRPKCVSSFLRQFGMTLNDSLGDAKRQRLRPYLARMIGTNDDGLDDVRAQLAVKWVNGLPITGVDPTLGTSAFSETMAHAVVSSRQRRYVPSLRPEAEFVGYADGEVKVLPVACFQWNRVGEADEIARLCNEVRSKFAQGVPDSVFELLHAMLPLEPIDVPVAADWREVVAV